MDIKRSLCEERPVEEYVLKEEPYYVPIGNEIEVFTAAYENNLPINLKGPTGCGKTRFMEYMAYRLKRPLITISCHEDLTASDLIGRFLIKGGEHRVERWTSYKGCKEWCYMLSR